MGYKICFRNGLCAQIYAARYLSRHLPILSGLSSGCTHAPIDTCVYQTNHSVYSCDTKVWSVSNVSLLLCCMQYRVTLGCDIK